MMANHIYFHQHIRMPGHFRHFPTPTQKIHPSAIGLLPAAERLMPSAS